MHHCRSAREETEHRERWNIEHQYGSVSVVAGTHARLGIRIIIST